MQSRSEGQLPATPGMPLTWVQETAGPFFRPGPSMAFNHDRLIDSRGDSAGERKVSLFPLMLQLLITERYPGPALWVLHMPSRLPVSYRGLN